MVAFSDVLFGSRPDCRAAVIAPPGGGAFSLARRQARVENPVVIRACVARRRYQFRGTSRFATSETSRYKCTLRATRQGRITTPQRSRSMDTLRIGFIGAGANTRSRHLPGFQAIEDVELHAVANRTRASGQRVADEWSVGHVYDHWHQVIEDPQVDAVCIGTWPYLHAPATCAALEAGKHVLCEARMAMNASEARTMLACAQRTGLVAMLVPSPFGLKGDRTMRRLIADGYLGEVHEIYVRGLAPTMADATAPLHWRQRASLSGVNVLVLGILNETVQRWFGATESVAAQASIFVPRRRDPRTGDLQDVDVADSIAVLARTNSGATCVYHVSGHAHHAGGMIIEAYGSEGTLCYDLSTDALRGARAEDKALVRVEIPTEEASGWRVEADFVDAVRDGAPVRMTSFSDGVKYMLFTEAVHRSAATGRRVALAEV